MRRRRSQNLPIPKATGPEALRAAALQVLALLRPFTVKHPQATFPEIKDAIDAAREEVRQASGAR